MTRVSRRGFLATSAAAAAWPFGPGIETTQAPRRVRLLAAETPYWLQATGTPGFSVALLEGGKTREVICFGFTDSVGTAPVTKETIFQAASLSKQALLYAVLGTIEAGKLDLDRPLVQYLEKPLNEPEAGLDRISARHVLTHTTGWPNWPPNDGALKPVRPLGQWGYSGAGFFYLQQAMESIWAEPATRYTQRLVLDPLEMRSSSFVWRDEYQTTAVRGFDQAGAATEAWHPTTMNGASSLHTTASEYARLLEAYLSPTLRERHPSVYRRQVEIDSRLGWSLGWGTVGNTLWQWGHSDGFKTFAALVPARGVGIGCLANGAGGQRVNREWVNGWLGTDLAAFFFKNVEL